VAAHQCHIVPAKGFREIATLLHIADEQVGIAELSAMSQTGTSVPMKLPEWITGRSFVASATPKARGVLGMRVHYRRDIGPSLEDRGVVTCALTSPMLALPRVGSQQWGCVRSHQAAIWQYLNCAAARIWLSYKPSNHLSRGRERPSI
jgi:hypothetical protein